MPATDARPTINPLVIFIFLLMMILGALGGTWVRASNNAAKNSNPGGFVTEPIFEEKAKPAAEPEAPAPAPQRQVSARPQTRSSTPQQHTNQEPPGSTSVVVTNQGGGSSGGDVSTGGSTSSNSSSTNTGGSECSSMGLNPHQPLSTLSDDMGGGSDC